ncbi:hypothetical protein [Aneurinibacillus migulanus]|uniref:hypothetical protein n=1 Tax=Aneurinibacillus migulanus TaxID=47500 RepID=UPI001F466BDF|nr:hypothetical protein [Aneurinibacillus migulanus]
MVRGKKRRKGGGRERSEKNTLPFLLPDHRAHPTSSFFRISSFQPHSPVKISSVIFIKTILHPQSHIVSDTFDCGTYCT